MNRYLFNLAICLAFYLGFVAGVSINGGVL